MTVGRPVTEPVFLKKSVGLGRSQKTEKDRKNATGPTI